MIKNIICIVLLLIVFMSAGVFAEEMSEEELKVELIRIKNIKNDIKRLQAYDKLAKKIKTNKSQTKLVGEWVLIEDVYAMGMPFAKAGSTIEFNKNGEFYGIGSNYGTYKDKGDKILMTDSEGTSFCKYKTVSTLPG